MKRLNVLVVTMALVLPCTHVSYATSSNTVSKWAQPSIDKIFDAGFISEDEIKKAKDKITRLEFSEIIVSFYEEVTGEEVKVTKKNPFEDTDDVWIMKAYEANIISGVTKAEFKPDEYLTREQMAIILTRTLESLDIDLMPTARDNPFEDTKTLELGARKSINKLYGAKILVGDSDGKFYPFKEITTQEAIVGFVNALNYYENIKESYNTSILKDDSIIGEKPEIIEPETVEPEIIEPETVEPETVKPETVESETETVKPETVEPETETVKPEIVEPETVKPEIIEPETIKPQTVEPEIIKPETNINEEDKIKTKEDFSTITIAGKDIKIGQSIEEVVVTFGEPSRIDDTIYGFERYIYNNQYEEYFFVTFKDDIVVEIFTPMKDFLYMGTVGEGTVTDIKHLDYISNVDNTGMIKSDKAEAKILLDYQGNISGILLKEKEFAYGNYIRNGISEDKHEDILNGLLDLIQINRLAEGVELLKIDERLNKSAVTHSQDMAKNKYFDYTGLNGSTPFERMANKRISFTTASEVIAKQRGDIVSIYMEWIGTPAQMQSLKSAELEYVGIGAAQYDKQLYITVDLCGGVTEKN